MRDGCPGLAMRWSRSTITANLSLRSTHESLVALKEAASFHEIRFHLPFDNIGNDCHDASISGNQHPPISDQLNAFYCLDRNIYGFTSMDKHITLLESLLSDVIRKGDEAQLRCHMLSLRFG